MKHPREDFSLGVSQNAPWCVFLWEGEYPRGVLFGKSFVKHHKGCFILVGGP